MILARVNYQDNNAIERLYAAFCVLDEVLKGTKPIIFCIGTDKDIWDCLGPMTGSMLASLCPEAIIVGSLEKPVTAKNIGSEAFRMGTQYPDLPVLAVDASASKLEHAGTVIFKEGSIIPGRAVNKRLPAVGDYSITAIVDHQGENWAENKSIKPVYYMAGLISTALSQWIGRE